VRLTLRAKNNPWQGDLQISARDGDDHWATYTGGALAELRIESGDSQEITTYVRVGRQNSTLRVAAVPAGAVAPTVTQTFPLPEAVLATQQRVLVVGRDIDLASALRLIPQQSDEELVGTHLDDAAQLPADWIAYDGVDILVLTTTRTGVYEALTPAQQDALTDWVRMGGRVLLTVGADGEELLSEPTVVGRLTPGKFDRTLPLRETAVLETFAEATQPLDRTAEGQRRPPPLYTQLRDVQGEVLLSAGDRPIIIRAAHGFGQVVFLGLDLETAPLSDWQDHSRFLASLIELALGETAAADERPSGEAAHLGFDDIAGQLRAALEVYQGVSIVPFSWVAALIVAYVLLIGPLDYFLVSRVLRRRELTWITSGVVILGFCALAWWLAARSRGESVRLNQVDVVDVDMRTSQLRGTTWLHLYSPNNRQFDLVLKPQSQIVGGHRPHVRLGWQGLPGESLGGMNRPSRIDAGGPEYLLANASSRDGPANVSIQGLPVAAGGSKALSARWWAQARPLGESALQATSTEQLVGHFDNPLPVRLTNCLLFHDRWVYRLGNLEPGQRVVLDEFATPFNAEWVLTERRIVEAREETRPWDQAMREDVPKIVRMMLFHEVAHGRAHTDLLNRHYGNLDMSALLRADRAVLLGTAAEPAARLRAEEVALDSDGNQHWTFYRIVLPTSRQN